MICNFPSLSLFTGKNDIYDSTREKDENSRKKFSSGLKMSKSFTSHNLLNFHHTTLDPKMTQKGWKQLAEKPFVHSTVPLRLTRMPRESFLPFFIITRKGARKVEIQIKGTFFLEKPLACI